MRNTYVTVSINNFGCIFGISFPDVGHYMIMYKTYCLMTKPFSIFLASKVETPYRIYLFSMNMFHCFFMPLLDDHVFLH